MKEKWRQKYNRTRVVMWDNTNMTFIYQPGGVADQCLAYNLYYATNCEKGSVCCKVVAWMDESQALLGGCHK